MCSLVIFFGLGLTGLIVYAVSSELFADNSPSKLFDQAAEFIRNDPEVNSILLQPLRFHAESSGGRRNRRIRSSHSTDRASGLETMSIRFAVEGKDPITHGQESWYESVKRWLRPVIVEPSHPTDVIPTAPAPHKVPTKSEESSSWLSGIFGSILPSSFAQKATGASETKSSSKLRSKPRQGSFQAGEAVASFILQEDGKFRIESLSVYFPGA